MKFVGKLAVVNASLPVVPENNGISGNGMKPVIGVFWLKYTLSGNVDDTRMFVATVAQIGALIAREMVCPGGTVTVVGSCGAMPTGGSVLVISTICICQLRIEAFVASVLLRVFQISNVQVPLAV